MIVAFGNKSKWVDVQEDFKVLVDYPTVAQKYKLEGILFNGADLDKDMLSKIELAKWNHWVRHYLKYVIKDWQGLKNEDGQEIKCELIGNELKDELWEGLCQVDEIVFLLYNKISEVLRWNASDKKKRTSSEDSDLRADSGELINPIL